ncbi:MAG: lipocalin-like domain-containing protein [Gemmatimonadota bacterium]|nr:lipocalin-like domain-containing protein [Gemmatimonadota bacterium]
MLDAPPPRTRRGPSRSTLVAAVSAVVASAVPADPAVAQDPSPRFGVWKLRSDAPPPAVNIMTYEPYGDGGMRITVWSTNGDGETNEWGYVTMFDEEFRPVSGQENAETAVEFVDERTTRIRNRRNGRVSQEIINVLSDDGNTIENEYIRIAEDGTRRSSHAVYERVLRDPSQLVGRYELESVEGWTEDGGWVAAPGWSDPSGYLVYDADGTMRVQLTATPPPPDNAEIIGGNAAYYGTWEVHRTEATVSHHRVGHLDPAQRGTTVKRSFEFDGERLRLSPAPERTVRLTWRRVMPPPE